MNNVVYVIGYDELGRFNEFMNGKCLTYPFRDEDNGRNIINPSKEEIEAIELWQQKSKIDCLDQYR